jgi:hypothetical protein
MAKPVLDKNIYHLPAQTTEKLVYQDSLKYHLYGAMIYIGLWEWARALEFLEIVIASPVSSTNVSMIQVEAYKQWVLVSLLVHGKVRPTITISSGCADPEVF